MNSSNERDEFEVRNTSDIQNTMTIPKIHCAYEDSLQLINLFEQAFVLRSDLAMNISKTVSTLRDSEDPKLKCLELVLLEEILSLCSHSRDCTSKLELAEKYISSIRKWQPLVEEALCQLSMYTDNKSYRINIRYVFEHTYTVTLYIVLTSDVFGYYFIKYMIRTM